MFDLKDRTAMVTGASGAIGRAIAVALARRGARLILTGRRKEALQETASMLPSNTAVISANLVSSEETDALISAAEEATEGLAVDILVNNAGITRDMLLLRMKDEDWQQVLDVNLTAVFRLTRATLKTMVKRRYGRIINITSIVGITGNPGQANYAASKAGLIGFTKALALEVAGRGITANCIAPGFISSAMTDALNESQRQTILARVPAGRLGTPDDIAASAIYLASEEAAYITGQTLHVNGGMALI